MPPPPDGGGFVAGAKVIGLTAPASPFHSAHAHEDRVVKLSSGILRLVVAELGQHRADVDAEYRTLIAQLQTHAEDNPIRMPSGKCPQPRMIDIDPEEDFKTPRERHWPNAALPVVAEPLRSGKVGATDQPLESAVYSNSTLTYEWKNQLVKVFHELDQDGGGTINTNELRKALSSVGIARARAQKLVNDADWDRSGEIDLVEWRKAIEKGNDSEIKTTMEKLANKVEKSGSLKTAEPDLENSPCMIKPGSYSRLFWDAIIALQCLYIAIVLPVTTTLDEHIGKATMDVFTTIGLVIDILFLFDVLLNFRTGYYAPSGLLVMSSRKVACAYLRSWFFLDFISSIPVDGISSGQVISVRFLKVLKVGKLGRVFKLVVPLLIQTSSSDFLGFFDNLLLSPTLRSVFRRSGMSIGTVLLCHWMACLMLLSSDWIKVYEDGVLYGSWSDMYLAGVYWATTTMTTVGYGDITPSSNVERVISMFAMVLGGAYYGYAIGTICSIVLDRDINVRVYHDRMDQVYFWLDRHKLPREMRSAVIRHFKSLLAEKAAVDESSVFDELSPAIKKAVGEYVVHSDIRENPLFDGIPLNAVVRLQTIVQPMMAEAGHGIVACEEVGTAMFIVREGELYMSKDGSDSEKLRLARHDRTLEPGDSFGEEILVGLMETYQYTVQAITDTKLWMINENDFSSLFSHMPDVVKAVQKNASALLMAEGSQL